MLGVCVSVLMRTIEETRIFPEKGPCRCCRLLVAGSSASYFMLLAELVIVFFVLKIDIYIQTPRGGLQTLYIISLNSGNNGGSGDAVKMVDRE